MKQRMISRMVSRMVGPMVSVDAIRRYFATLGGVNETALPPTYTAVDGDVLTFKLSTTKTGDQTYFDESTGLNRLFLQLGTLGTAFTFPAGVTIDVDGNGNVFVPDGRLSTVTMTIGAAAAGLVIDHYWSKFDGTEFVQGTPADIGYAGSDNRFYSIDDNTSGVGAVMRDTLGGQDGIYVNLVADHWEQMTQVGIDWLGSELVPQPIDFSSDWAARGSVPPASGDTFTTSTTGGQGFSFAHNLAGKTMQLVYSITTIDANWAIKDWLSVDQGDIVVGASADQSGVVIYNALEQAAYIRRFGTAGADLTLNRFSIKRILQGVV